jgi:hypothetical protein
MEEDEGQVADGAEVAERKKEKELGVPLPVEVVTAEAVFTWKRRQELYPSLS